jgi:SAM-dependent methyltransferase
MADHRDHDAGYWNLTARKTLFGQDFDEVMAEQYRWVHLELLARWVDLSRVRSILKTDLFAEAMCPGRAFLWEILKINANVTAMDVSGEICLGAGKVASIYAPGNLPKIVTCDVRKLPFADASFDLIISDSTLDHYKNKADNVLSLKEIKRVLSPGGTLVITLDNGGNITEPLFRLWIHLRLAPFYIGKTYSMRELKKALEEIGLYVSDETAIMHNPRFFTKMGVRLIRLLRGDKGSPQIRDILRSFDRMEKKKTRLLTAQFIAVRAIKPAL